MEYERGRNTASVGLLDRTWWVLSVEEKKDLESKEQERTPAESRFKRGPRELRSDDDDDIKHGYAWMMIQEWEQPGFRMRDCWTLRAKKKVSRSRFFAGRVRSRRRTEQGKLQRGSSYIRNSMISWKPRRVSAREDSPNTLSTIEILKRRYISVQSPLEHITIRHIRPNSWQSPFFFVDHNPLHFDRLRFTFA